MTNLSYILAITQGLSNRWKWSDPLKKNGYPPLSRCFWHLPFKQVPSSYVGMGYVYRHSYTLVVCKMCWMYTVSYCITLAIYPYQMCSENAGYRAEYLYRTAVRWLVSWVMVKCYTCKDIIIIREAFQKKKDKLGLFAQPPLTPPSPQNLGPLIRCIFFSFRLSYMF